MPHSTDSVGSDHNTRYGERLLTMSSGNRLCHNQMPLALTNIQYSSSQDTRTPVSLSHHHAHYTRGQPHLPPSPPPLPPTMARWDACLSLRSPIRSCSVTPTPSLRPLTTAPPTTSDRSGRGDLGTLTCGGKLNALRSSRGVGGACCPNTGGGRLPPAPGG